MVLPDSTPDQLPTLPAFAPPADFDATAVAKAFLGRVEAAIAAGDGDAFASLFIPHGYWRDVLAFTREFHTFKSEHIAQVGNDVFSPEAGRDFRVSDPAPALATPFPDLAFLRVHFTFNGEVGPGSGVAALVYSGEWRAWTLSTALEGVHGVPQRLGDERVYGRHNDTMPYDARRALEGEFSESQPDILVVGAGHNGLAVAALAKTWGLEPLVIDREERIGDNWRKRYASLSLHDPVMTNHLPLLPFPRNWPLFTPAGKLANWLESYADIMEVSVWLRSTTDGARTRFDRQSGKWTVVVVRTHPDGRSEEREIVVSHVVMATGLGGGRARVPPPFPGQETWDGVIVHSSTHPGGEALRGSGERVLVVGACTSAFDISADLANNGVEVTMLQRSPTFIMSMQHGIKVLEGGIFNNVVPIDVADRIATSTPRALVKLFHQRLTAWLKIQDADLLAGLEARGFRTYSGPEGAGFAFREYIFFFTELTAVAAERGGGYYFDTGACPLIAAGKILIQSGEIAAFGADRSITFSDGSSARFDRVVFATGFYDGYKESAAQVLGPAGEGLQKVFGMDPEGEMHGIARPCGIPHVLFNVGNLASSRIFAKAVVLQILAQKRGVWRSPYYRPQESVNGVNGVKGVNGVTSVNGANGHGVQTA